MTFTKIFALLTIAGVCGLSASVASAATVQVAFGGDIFKGLGSDQVAITFPSASSSGPTTLNVLAGRFQGAGSNVVGVPESIFVDSVKSISMYCYDLYELINNNQTVTYQINLNGELARTLDFLGAVNSVLNQSTAAYDPFAWLRPMNGNQAAAIQLGIWESKYDTDNWDLAGGAFKASGLEQATQRWWDQFKNAIAGSDALDGKYVMTLEAKGAQDMITGDPSPSEVPEPGSLALLGVALAGLAATRRNKGSAK